MARNARVGGVYATFFARNEDFLRKTKQNIAAIQRQRQIQNNLRRSAYQVRNTFKGLTSTFAAFAGVAGVGAVVTGLTRATREAGQFAVVMERQASAIGLQVSEFSKLSAAFQTFGGEAEDLFDIIKEVDVRTAEAITGATVAVEAFTTAGVDFKKAFDDNLSSIERFNEFADGVKGLVDSGRKDLALFVANELLGDIGTRFVGFLELGSEGIRDLVISMGDLAGLTDEQFNNLISLDTQYVKSTKKISNSVRGIIADNTDVFERLLNLGEVVIPGAFKGVTSTIGFLQENLYLVRLAISALAVRLISGTGLPKFIFDLIVATNYLKATTTATHVLRAAVGALKRAFLTFLPTAIFFAVFELGVQFAFLSKEAGGSGAAISTLGQRLAQFGRVSAARIRVVVAELKIFGLEILRTFIESLSLIDDFFRDVFNGVVDFLEGAWQSIVSIWDGLGDTFSSVLAGLGDLLKSGLTNIIIGVINGINSLLRTLFSFATFHPILGIAVRVAKFVGENIIGALKELFVAVLPFIRGFFYDALAGLQGFVASGLESLQNFIRGFDDAFKEVRIIALQGVELISAVFRDFPNTIKAVFQLGFNGILELFEGLVNGIIKRINNFSDKVNNAFSFIGVGDLVSDIALIDVDKIKVNYDGAADEIVDSLQSTFAQIRAEVEASGGLSDLLTGTIDSVRLSQSVNQALADAERAVSDSQTLGGALAKFVEDQYNDLLAGLDEYIAGLEDVSAAEKERLQELINSNKEANESLGETGDTIAGINGELSKLGEEGAAYLSELGNKTKENNDEMEEDTKRTFESIVRDMKGFNDQLLDIFERSTGAIGDLVGDIVVGFKDAEEAAKQFAKTLIRDVVSALVKSGLKKLLGSFLGISFPFFQHGGLAERGLAVVGEAGPELVDFRSPGRVYTNDQLSAAVHGGGGGNNFYFQPNIYSSDGAAVTKSLRDAFPIFQAEIMRTFRQEISSPTNTRVAVRG